MKISLVRLSLLALPFLPLSQTRAALNPALVSADARWVVYADLNALRASSIGKELIGLAEKAQLDTGNGKVGIDWQKLLATVGTATAYGTNISSDPKQIDGALVIQGTADLRKIAESVLLQANLAHPENVVEITDLPFPAYALRNTKAKDAAQMEVVIAFPPEPIVLISKSRPQLLKARDVFRGSAPSLANGPASPLKKFVAASDSAYLFAASVVPAEKFFPEDGPQTRILIMANAGSLALGERGPSTFAHAELIASSDQMADKLMKILQGMTAMMSLAETSDKALADFLSSAAVNRQGDAVTLDLAYSSERLVQMIKGLQQRQEQRPQDRAAARTAQMIVGKAVAEWQAEPVAVVEGAAPAPLAVRTVENVALKNGTLITLARLNNGGKNTRFDRVEIVAADGAGAPLVFRSDFMRTAGPRGNWSQIQFPGADGTYTLKVSYVNDADGKATYAVSIRDPKPATAEPEAKTK
jgi:hypothetical protein